MTDIDPRLADALREWVGDTAGTMDFDFAAQGIATTTTGAALLADAAVGAAWKRLEDARVVAATKHSDSGWHFAIERWEGNPSYLAFYVGDGPTIEAAITDALGDDHD